MVIFSVRKCLLINYGRTVRGRKYFIRNFLRKVLEFQKNVDNPYNLYSFLRIPTAWHRVPVSAVDDVVLPSEVLVVAWPSVWIGHGVVGAGVDGGEPPEEAVVWGWGVFASSPVTCHVEWVRDHQLTAVQVGAQYEGNGLHPPDHSTCLRGNLQPSVSKQQHNFTDALGFTPHFKFTNSDTDITSGL